MKGQNASICNKHERHKRPGQYTHYMAFCWCVHVLFWGSCQWVTERVFDLKFRRRSAVLSSWRVRDQESWALRGECAGRCLWRNTRKRRETGTCQNRLSQVRWPTLKTNPLLLSHECTLSLPTPPPIVQLHFKMGIMDHTVAHVLIHFVRIQSQILSRSSPFSFVWNFRKKF